MKIYFFSKKYFWCKSLQTTTLAVEFLKSMPVKTVSCLYTILQDLLYFEKENLELNQGLCADEKLSYIAKALYKNQNSLWPLSTQPGGAWYKNKKARPEV